MAENTILFPISFGENCIFRRLQLEKKYAFRL